MTPRIGKPAREWHGSTGPVKAFTVDCGNDWIGTDTMRAIGESFPALRFLGVVPLTLEDVPALPAPSLNS